MAYSVDWIAKVVTIPTADLTLISGARYSLSMSSFLAEARRLEWEPTEGLWAPSIVDHTNTRLDFAGADYAPFDDLINGYTVVFTGAATRVDLLGSNNDLIDVLIPTGVSIVPSNSAGLIVKTVGSGVLPQDVIDIKNAIFNEIMEDSETLKQALMLIRASAAGRIVEQPDGSYLIKSSDGTKNRIDGSQADNGGRDINSTDVT